MLGLLCFVCVIYNDVRELLLYHILQLYIRMVVL